MALRRPKPARVLTGVERRVARIDTPDLSGWAEQTLTGLSRAFGDWRRDPAGPGLEEAEIGAEALLAIIREMRRRFM